MCYYAVSILHGQNDTAKSKIIGKWTTGQNNMIVEYTADGYYIAKLGGVILYNYQYKAIEKNDCTIIYKREPETGKLKLKKVFKHDGDKLISVGFKSFDFHIDEVAIYQRHGSIPEKDFNESGYEVTNYYFPDKFRGITFVAYQQPLGVKLEYGVNGERILRINNSRLSETQFKETPFSFARNKFNFYYYSNGLPIRELPFVTKHEFSKLRYGKEKEKHLRKYALDSVYVYVMGYNQAPREYINKIVGKELEGNIEVFKVDTLKNLLTEKIFEGL